MIYMLHNACIRLLVILAISGLLARGLLAASPSRAQRPAPDTANVHAASYKGAGACPAEAVALRQGERTGVPPHGPGGAAPGCSSHIGKVRRARGSSSTLEIVASAVAGAAAVLLFQRWRQRRQLQQQPQGRHLQHGNSLYVGSQQSGSSLIAPAPVRTAIPVPPVFPARSLRAVELGSIGPSSPGPPACLEAGIVHRITNDAPRMTACSPFTSACSPFAAACGLGPDAASARCGSGSTGTPASPFAEAAAQMGWAACTVEPCGSSWMDTPGPSAPCPSLEDDATPCRPSCHPSALSAAAAHLSSCCPSPAGCPTPARPSARPGWPSLESVPSARLSGTSCMDGLLSPKPSSELLPETSVEQQLLPGPAEEGLSAGIASTQPSPLPPSHEEEAQGRLLSPASLPPSLRACYVDPGQIVYLQWGDGSLQQLGTGASSTVFRASLAKEEVAVKVMHVGRSTEAQQAFITEALRLQQLRCRHVVAFLGVSLDGPNASLIMEYCAGGELLTSLGRQFCRTGQRLFGWQRRGRKVALQLAKALAYLHSMGVVHMDVKSSNVLLTSRGSAKLTDVGLSQLQINTYLPAVPCIGTFAWAAPEVLLGGHECDRALDIYSFGVVLWELLTGERPVRGNLRMPTVPDECPQEAVDLFLQCTSTDPRARPTADELVERLRQPALS